MIRALAALMGRARGSLFSRTGVTMDVQNRIFAEIECRALGGDLDRAANLLGYAKEVGLCLSPPDLFERELAVDPLAGHFYRCRARIKWRSDLREEALVDMTRALLVARDEELLVLEAGRGQCWGTSRTARTARARSPRENGFWMKFIPLSRTPW